MVDYDNLNDDLDDNGNDAKEIEPSPGGIEAEDVPAEELNLPPSYRVSADQYSAENIQSFLSFIKFIEPTDLEDFFSKPENEHSVNGPLGKTIGIPEDDAKYWHQQQYPDTCAIVSQEYILETFTGDDFSEQDLAVEAMSKGYYLPGVGTYPDSVGKLLEDHGIEVERSTGNTIDDIKEMLSSGKKIIVGLDAYEIWDPSGVEQLMDLVFLPEANHAVMVTGYNDISQEVILNDPGHPGGAGMRVSLSDFENAWNDSDCFMVNTVRTPPSFTA